MQMKASIIGFAMILPLTIACSDYRRTPNPDSKLSLNLAKCENILRSNQLPANLAFQNCEQVKSQWLLRSEYDSCIDRAYKAHESTKFFPQSADSVSRKMPSSSSSRNTAASAKGADILTNVRHAGVDEGDFVKVSDEQIFVVGSEGINVVDRKTKQLIGTLSLEKNKPSSSNSPWGQRNIELLVYKDKLIVLDSSTLQVFDIVPQALPRLRQRRDLNERIVETRLLKDRITIVTESFLKTERATSSDGNTSNLPILNNENCSTFYPSANLFDSSTAMTRVETFSVDNIAESTSMTFLGDSKLYMTDRSIYLYQDTTATSWRNASRISPSNPESSYLRKIEIKSDGSLANPTSGVVKGRIKDVWALSELQTGELAIASTTGNLWDDSARNHFTILSNQDGQLKKIGETPEYGAKEDIRSVRFVGNTAYVVTFKKTDPLYAIDISEPASPKILGELKIPGFSTYMHPLNKDQLIGLGFDAIEQGSFALYQGLQLSLFNVSNPKDMTRSAVKIFGSRGSSSNATNDHRAFFLDAQQGIIGFPVQLNLTCTESNPACSEQLAAIPGIFKHRNFMSGAALVSIEGEKYGAERFISHTDLLPQNCLQYPTHAWWENPAQTMDVERILKLDGELLSVSKFGLKYFRIGEQIETLHTTRWNNSCERR